MAHQEMNEHESERLEAMADSGQWLNLSKALAEMDPADIADFIEDIEEEEHRAALFHQLPPGIAADVLTELQVNFSEDVLENMPLADIADLAELMAPDDSADMLDALDDDRTAEVLAAMEPEERKGILPLLSYAEDSAGHIMTPEIIQVPPGFTIAQTRRLLASAERTTDPIFYIYVCDPVDQRLLGLVSLADLFLSDNQDKVDTLCITDYIFATSDEDQQDVARKFRKYDVWVMPVVDENHKLVGRITVDDIVDVIHEEADEDLAHMIGAPDIETEEDAPFSIAKQRLPWLMITMFAGLANSIVIKYMIDTTNEGTLAIFVPAILAMGGNTGMQSSAIAVRGIALGLQRYNRLRQIVTREMKVGVIMGIACALLTATTVGLVLYLTGADTGGVSTIALTISVGCAMANAMIFASGFGVLTPVIMHRLGVDPAVASGPFVTTSNDLSASFIYFATCLVVIKIFPG